jgi:hypothetical protein
VSAGDDERLVRASGARQERGVIFVDVFAGVAAA